MAGSSLLALIDDIASILDDVAAMSKVAAKKTAGVLGDDLALNAQQVSGVKADRELPVVWAVAKGSFKNKAILVPVALGISAIIPWAVTPLLMIGGLFLCYEGFEKLAHSFMHRKTERDDHQATPSSSLNSAVLAKLEKAKIQGAIRTDFILSAEIITIALGTVATAPFPTQVATLVVIGIIMTVGVYGFVAAIVKLDDGGLYLSLKSDNGVWGTVQRGIGEAILKAAPYLMKSLSIVGTVAMFMVGGGILTHGIPVMHDFIHHLTESISTLPTFGTMLGAILPALLGALMGVVAGGMALLGVMVGRRLFKIK